MDTTASNNLAAGNDWLFLGDLPYRCVKVYDDVSWEWAPTHNSRVLHDESKKKKKSVSRLRYYSGLSCIPIKSAQLHSMNYFFSPQEYFEYLSATTNTTVTGCPNGGPIATVTISNKIRNNISGENFPIDKMGVPFSHSVIRITTSSGRFLCSIRFPPKINSIFFSNLYNYCSHTSHDVMPLSRNITPWKQRAYYPNDIVSIGFTSRCVLIIVLRDSLCLTYTISGEALLPPFYIIPLHDHDIHKNTKINNYDQNASTCNRFPLKISGAYIFEGGVAVFSNFMTCGIVEILDEMDEEVGYVSECHAKARQIDEQLSTKSRQISSLNYNSSSSQNHPNRLRYLAVITPCFSASSYASANKLTFLSLAVLDKQHTQSHHPELFLSTSDNSVIIIDCASGELLDVDCRGRMTAPIVKMSFAPNGRFLACFLSNEKRLGTEESPISLLTVVTPNFQGKILDFDTSRSDPIRHNFENMISRFSHFKFSCCPSSLKWCGEDSVLLQWDHFGIFMVGPYGDWIQLPYKDQFFGNSENHSTDGIHIVPELDSCRIITNKFVDILQRVPSCFADMMQFGSIRHGAMLYDSAMAFEKGLVRGFDSARLIEKKVMNEAVEECIEAAVEEFDRGMQITLMIAASYGITFINRDTKIEESNNNINFNAERDNIKLPKTFTLPGPTYTSKLFVSSAHKLRVLNALRHPDIGFLMTSQQFDAIGPNGIVARLIAMRRPALANEIAEYMDLDDAVRAQTRVSRACAFVMTQTSDMGLKNSNTDSQVAKVAMGIIEGTYDCADQIKEYTNNKHYEVLEMNTHEYNYNIERYPIPLSLHPDTDTYPFFSSNHYPEERTPIPSLINRGGYAIVALTAYVAGRHLVSDLLLTKEISVPEKVHSLIIMGLYSDAATVAAKAQEADLLMKCILELETRCLSSDFNKSQAMSRFWNIVLTNFPAEGGNLLQLYYVTYRTKNVDSIKCQELNLLLRAKNYCIAGSILASRVLYNTVLDDEKIMLLKEASRVLGIGHDGIFEKSCVDELLDLMSEQERLRRELSPEIVTKQNFSIISTLHNIYSYAARNPRKVHRILAEGDRFIRKYRISEKRLWYVKIKAFSASHQWSNLRSLANSRSKPPIGFVHFALAAVHGKQSVGEILRYVDKITNGDERYNIFCEAALWKRALEEARKLEDSRRKILYIRSRCDDFEIKQLCESLLHQ